MEGVHYIKCIKCEHIKRHHRRNLNNTRLPAKVKKSILRRQRVCEVLTAIFLLLAFILIASAPLLLIPILTDFQKQSLTFTIYLCICCAGAAVCILLAACFGNLYWFFDRRKGRISWFMHYGTGPIDYYWGKALSGDSGSLDQPDCGRRRMVSPAPIALVQMHPNAPGLMMTLDGKQLMDYATYKMLAANQISVHEMAKQDEEELEAVQEEDEEEQDEELPTKSSIAINEKSLANGKSLEIKKKNQQIHEVTLQIRDESDSLDKNSSRARKMSLD